MKIIFVLCFFILGGWHAVQALADESVRVSCLGQIVAGERAISVSAPQGAIVERLLVKRGDWVDAGDELAHLRDHAIHAAAVDRAEKEIALALASLELAGAGERRELLTAQQAVVNAREASVRLHRVRKERREHLKSRTAVSAEEYEDADHALDVAVAELNRERSLLQSFLSGREEVVREAEARLAVARADHRLEIARLEGQIVRAPMAGKVLSIQTYPGEAVGGEGILDLADTRNMMILAEVYETDIVHVRVGMQARIRTAVLEGEVTGEVVEIHNRVEAGRIFSLDPLVHTDRRTVMVRIRPDAPEPLAPFNNAQVTVILGGFPK